MTALLHSVEWYGGGSPPARYLVPLLPVLALTWAVVLRRPVRWRRLAELLLPPSLVVWWALITRPHFSINPGDGGWWLTDALARRFSADVAQFFPSLLVPTTATFAVPVAVLIVAVAARWLAWERRRRTLALRVGLAGWLVAAGTLTVAIMIRYDRMVEVEAPQVRRRGGQPVPPTGTFSRFSYPNGWRLGDGDEVVVPLHIREGSGVWLEGWLLGTAQRGGRLELQWDEGEPVVLPVRGSTPHGRVPLPDPPGAGRHRLRLAADMPPGGAVVLDRVVVER
jgi:hypothetical protein